MGAATARMLSKLGAKVVLGARREKQLRTIVEELGENAILLKPTLQKNRM